MIRETVLVSIVLNKLKPYSFILFEVILFHFQEIWMERLIFQDLFYVQTKRLNTVFS